VSRSRPDALSLAYDAVCDQWSDVSAQIPALESACAGATRVVELGVRWATSTVVLLHALEGRGRLWSVDVDWPSGPYVDALVMRAIALYDDDPPFTFVHGDDLDPSVLARLPDDLDVCFIDTSHGYGQTRAELEAYGPKMRAGGLLLLHDTNLEHPETGGPHPCAFPVRQAVLDWCGEHERVASFDEEGYGLATIRC
jgi:predicted O-methyltransferase YrrM